MLSTVYSAGLFGIDGFPVSVESMQEHLSDIAGIRVLCAYIDDIYEIARMLARQQDVRIICVKEAPLLGSGKFDYRGAKELVMGQKG